MCVDGEHPQVTVTVCVPGYEDQVVVVGLEPPAETPVPTPMEGM